MNQPEELRPQNYSLPSEFRHIRELAKLDYDRLIDKITTLEKILEKQNEKIEAQQEEIDSLRITRAKFLGVTVTLQVVIGVALRFLPH